LGIIEIGGYGYDGVLDFFTEVVFGGFFHFDEDHGGDFFRGVLFFLSFDFDFNPGFGVFVDDIEG